MSGEHGVLELLGIQQGVNVTKEAKFQNRSICIKDTDDEEPGEDDEERGFSDSSPSPENKGFAVAK